MNRRWRALKAGSCNESGQTLVETAVCTFIYFLLFFAIFDFGFLFYSKVTLQNAVRQAGRYAITGNCNSGTCFDPNNGSGDRLNSIINTAVSYSFGLITSSNIMVQCIAGTCSSGYGYGTNNAGGPGDTVQITATYTFSPLILTRFFTGYQVIVKSTFTNEHFAPPPPS